MNKILCSLFCLFCISCLYSQNSNPKILAESSIDSVRVYLQGAEIFRTEELVIQPGRNHFIFTRLSSKLYPQSIQVSSKNAQVSIRSVTSKTNFLEKRSEDKRILRLKDSLLVVRDGIALLNDELDAFREEKDFLRQNKDFKGKDKTLSVDELINVADFFRNRNKEINKAITKRNRSKLALNRQLFDLKLMLEELNAGQIPTAEVHLILESPRALKSKVTLRYVVADAGWAALYRLESSKLDEPIHLRYGAEAYNNTGVDWENVKVTLTTLDPLESASQPRMAIWDLDNLSSSEINSMANLDFNMQSNSSFEQGNFYDQVQTTLSLEKSRRVSDFQRIMGKDFDAEIDYETDLYRRSRDREISGGKIVQTELDVPEFNIDFPIPGTFTIPSDRKPYAMEIASHELDVGYKYYAVPKMDKDAFLIAQIVGWEELDLVSGPVNIYNGKRYIGQSDLDIRNLSDTLSVSMGRDKEVVVSRIKIKGKTRRQILGSTKKASIGYNISIANHKSQAIHIEVVDQIPISNNRDVFIELDEKSAAIYDEKVGTLEWRKVIEPSQTETVEFGFSVKYPKTQELQIQYKKTRRMAAPKFL